MPSIIVNAIIGTLVFLIIGVIITFSVIWMFTKITHSSDKEV